MPCYHAYMNRLALLACLLVLGCHDKGPPPPAAKPAPKPVEPDPCAKQQPEGPLAWFADDYPSALACARKKKVPLVIDLWAPWCHTCLSMRSTVLRDPALAADKDKFVFLALDTDREQNAAPLAKLAISAWPTFYVLGDDEAVLARFVGSASLAQFEELLDAAAIAAKGAPEARSAAHLLSAERALAIKEYQSAEEELAAALEHAPVAWSRRPELLGSLILTKYRRHDYSGCLDVADKYLDVTGNAAVASDFLVTAMFCADKLEHPVAPAPPPAADVRARIHALRERAADRWKGLLADKTAPLSIDDRSDAMASLREDLEALGKKGEARRVAEEQRALLDDAAAKAPDAMAAMTYNWPRAEVYVYLGRPLDLVPALEKSVKDLPGQYDPPARLGWIYLEAGKLAEAATWTDKALALVYGPRKGRLLAQRAEIATAAGDKKTARSYRAQEVKLFESLPPSQANPEALAKAKAALAALGPV
jgi:thiol-disulfide isomerase/thioredoxin